MATPKTGRLETGTAGTTSSSPAAQATPQPGRHEIGVTALRGLAGRYLDMTAEVRCVRK